MDCSAPILQGTVTEGLTCTVTADTALLDIDSSHTELIVPWHREAYYHSFYYIIDSFFHPL